MEGILPEATSFLLGDSIIVISEKKEKILTQQLTEKNYKHVFKS